MAAGLVLNYVDQNKLVDNLGKKKNSWISSNVNFNS